MNVASLDRVVVKFQRIDKKSTTNKSPEEFRVRDKYKLRKYH
jgi:hypothetical protein